MTSGMDSPAAGIRACLIGMLVAAALLAAAGPAGAAKPRPKITSLRCIQLCAGSTTVAPGGVVSIRGRRLTKGMKAVFRARTNAAGQHLVSARASGRARLTARVPGDASSGRVYVKKGHVRSNAAGPIKVRKLPPRTTPVVSTGQASAASFTGNGMWIWYVSQSNGGDPNSIIAQAQSHGISTVFVKSGDGTTYWPQFNAQFVGALKAAGLHVCAWQYVYGTDPAGEAAVAAQALQAGPDCFVIDAEKEYEGRYAQAQQYVRNLRAAYGPSFPIGLAGFPYVDYHPSYPYSVFLGPNGAQFNVPQIYWKEIGGGVDAVVDHSYRFNRPYGRAMAPLGQLYDNPPTSDIVRFRQLVQAEGSGGLSWWSWQAAQPAGWDAIAQPLPPFSGPPPASDDAVLASGAKGDLVVWAQELLNGSGQGVTVDGQYGSGTQTAVQAFQGSHGLPATGQVDTPTWNALLQYVPAEPDWGSQASAASAGRRTGPETATLPARRYEIRPQPGP
ncbi:MAG: peptidoglycan-binding protein [Thermoleophilaceae bacterium]